MDARVDPSPKPAAQPSTVLMDPTTSAILQGDETAFARLVDELGPTMLRVAMSSGLRRAIAEEVVQDAWISALGGLVSFEGRSSLRTWIMTILVNAARRRAVAESRTTPFSDVVAPSMEASLPEDDPNRERFFPGDHPRWAGCWTTVVVDPSLVPEDRLEERELERVTRDAMLQLPAGQQTVFRLRDVEGWTSREVCEALGITVVNQRVLLHRARTRVRAALERYLEADGLDR